MSSLQHKTILITGGDGGIGRATAELFLSRGARVVVTDKTWTSVPNVIHRITADATVEADVEKAVALARDYLGEINILFNNCGVGANLDMTEGRNVVLQGWDFQFEDMRRTMSTNLESAMFFTKHVARNMERTSGNCIISSSSVWAHGKLAGAQAYTASKAALTAVALQWAQDLRPIRSVALTLGAVDTPMLRANPRGVEEAKKESLLSRAIRPEEIAETVAFIAACEAVNATDLCIDGGSYNR